MYLPYFRTLHEGVSHLSYSNLDKKQEIISASSLHLCFQALHKLAGQYLKRDWPGINPDDQRTDYR